MAEFFRSDDDVFAVKIGGRFIGVITKADGFYIEPGFINRVVKFSPDDLREIAKIAEEAAKVERKNRMTRLRFSGVHGPRGA